MSLTIPDSVTSIENHAIIGCESLLEVIVPDSVISIGGNAFGGTAWIKAKIEEDPLVVVNGILIDGTTCDGDVIIPDRVTSIGDFAFNGCGLTSVTIPKGVTSIGEAAFLYCQNLISVTISDSVKNIDARAFMETPWLEAERNENLFVIINGILIDGFACNGDVILPDWVTSIGDRAFGEGYNLTSVTIPEGVTSIGTSAFSGCSNLHSITIENPDCNIFDCADTIYNRYDFITEKYNFDGTIYGYDFSTTQAYAEKYDRKFVSLGAKYPPVTTTIATTTTTTTATTLATTTTTTTTTLTTSTTTTTATTTTDTTIPPTTTEPAYMLGDVNEDGSVDSSDASLVLAEYAKIQTGGAGEFTGTQHKAADVKK